MSAYGTLPIITISSNLDLCIKMIPDGYRKRTQLQRLPACTQFDILFVETIDLRLALLKIGKVLHKTKGNMFKESLGEILFSDGT